MKKNFIKEKIEGLTDEQLEECFNDIEEYNKNAVMGDTLVRQIRDELATSIDDDRWDINCRNVVIPEILYEIARRHYSSK